MPNSDCENELNKQINCEESVNERLDAKGCRWKKVYFGGGIHFQHWLSQVIELKGQENVEVEETSSAGFKCFEQSGEKMYRIWVREIV